MTRPGMMTRGNELAVEGDMLQVGQSAPDFALTANDWQMKSLADYAGKVKIISIVPSLDTRVCATQTRRIMSDEPNYETALAVAGDLV